MSSSASSRSVPASGAPGAGTPLRTAGPTLSRDRPCEICPHTGSPPARTRACGTGAMDPPLRGTVRDPNAGRGPPAEDRC